MLRPHFAQANASEQLGNFHADVISAPLDTGKPLASVRLTCLSNEVIMGLLGVTMAR